MDELRPDHILQVGLGFWASKTLLSAVEMEVNMTQCDLIRQFRDTARDTRMSLRRSWPQLATGTPIIALASSLPPVTIALPTLSSFASSLQIVPATVSL